MAKKSAIITNNKRKKASELQKAKRAELKKIAKDTNLSFEDRLAAQVKLSKLPRNGAKDRVRNRCGLTGRPRGFFRYFGLSRIAIRDLASWAQLPGLRKSVTSTALPFAKATLPFLSPTITSAENERFFPPFTVLETLFTEINLSTNSVLLFLACFDIIYNINY